MAIARAQMADDDEKQTLVQQVSGWPVRARDYVSELQMEMRRVTWPNWKQVRATTIVVLVAVFAFAAYFMVVDWVVNNMVTKLFTALTR